MDHGPSVSERILPPGLSATASGLVASLLLTSACQGADDPSVTEGDPLLSGGPITFEELGVEQELGTGEEEGPLGVLHLPRAGILAGEEVLVLDGSAPWIRVFHRGDGTLARTLVPQGEGPGEATGGATLTSAGEGRFILNHPLGVTVFEKDGEPSAFLRRGGGHRYLGATPGCSEGEVLLFAFRADQYDPPGFLLRVPLDESQPDVEALFGDTVLILDRLRTNPQDSRPWFARRDRDRILMYTEEADRDRLLELRCDGASIGPVVEHPLDSLGPGARWEEGDGVLLYHLPEPPFPAGLGRVGERILWATNVEEDAPGGEVDSLTVISAWEVGSDREVAGDPSSVTVRGWYRLLDSDPEGGLLFSNTDGRNQTWGLVPRVIVVDGRRLLEAMGVSG